MSCAPSWWHRGCPDGQHVCEQPATTWPTRSGEGSTPIATSVTTTTFTDSGRVNGTTYRYNVAAVNAVGVSPSSNEASATPQSTQPTAPSAPTGLTATAGNASVALLWTAPASNGGSPVTGYAVLRLDAGRRQPDADRHERHGARPCRNGHPAAMQDS